MHAATASSSGDGTASAPSVAPKPSRSSRSHSFSSASIITVKRPGSFSSTSTGQRNSVIPTRSQSPAESRIPTRLSRETKSSDHQRRKSIAVDASESADATAGVDRWSHSSNPSSVTSTGHARRHRSSSGAILTNLPSQPLAPRHYPRTSVEHSPRSSPQKKKTPSRTNSLRQAPSPSISPQHSRRPSRATDPISNAQPTFAPLHSTTAFPGPDDTELYSTLQSSSYVDPDYLGSEEDAAPRSLSRTIHHPTVTRIPTSDMAGSMATDYAPTVGPGDREQGTTTEPTRHRHSHRRTRTKERADKDKKTMLAKALEKANTAVVLDNAHNLEGALDAYSDACALLVQVMERTSGDDDRRKLGEISETYSHRIAELSLLVKSTTLDEDEKNLPARPMSDGSTSPTSLVPMVVSASPARPSAALELDFNINPIANRTSFAPRLSYHKGDRDSFFSKTMAAVQGSMMEHDEDDANHTGSKDSSSSSFGVSQFTFDRDAIVGATEDEPLSLNRTSVHLPPPDHAQYMPRPLSPRRPQSPQAQMSPEEAWHAENETLSAAPQRFSPQRENSHESISWLDTIDESSSASSSRTSSVHSISSQQGLRRKHLRGISGDTDAEFDAAFDAAVEAAYNEGYEPDLDSRSQRPTAFSHQSKASLAVSSSDIREISHPHAFQPANSSATDLSDEEEERLLDEITHDFASGLGFSFDVQTKSALPRQSDSSGYSRSTWQSSQTSERATAATSLSTVAEDSLSGQATTRAMTAAPHVPGVRTDAPSGPLATAPPAASLPRPPSSSTSSVRNRRFSGQNPKQLKIETTSQVDSRKRASTFQHRGSPFAEEDEKHVLPLTNPDRDGGDVPLPASSDMHHELVFQPLPTLELHSIPDDHPRPVTASAATEYHRPSYEEFPDELHATRPTLFRKNKSSASLRAHTGHTLLLASPDLDSGPSLITPMSSTFATFVAKRNQNPLTSQRANLPPFGQAAIDGPNGTGVYLFDTSLSGKEGATSPRSPPLSQPPILEPCPESLLLRPFWLMRTLASTLIHPRGGFLTTKLFIPREVWQTRGVKLKLVEDKIANCDLLTAALGRLASVDSYDVDAIMDELQSFEEVVERVQTTLGKRLGSDVGVHGAASFFKDAAASSPSHADTGSVGAGGLDKASKSSSGKSYLSSWRKLRNKSSGTPLYGSGTGGIGIGTLSRQGSSVNLADKDHPHGNHLMPSVPMTSFVPVERRGQKRDTRNLVFDGPNKEYMGSLARLFDGVQILDQIARQVEDPGLKHSSPTHVGLELSTRHAAEFFAFYICRFVLADLGMLLEKFLKKGTEWVLA